MSEISKAMHELTMLPTNPEEQKKIQALLEDANEWGFQPVALDFEAFVRFIRHAREWKSILLNSKELEYAVQELGFGERIVHEYRVAFDIIDHTGAGALNIAG